MSRAIIKHATCPGPAIEATPLKPKPPNPIIPPMNTSKKSAVLLIDMQRDFWLKNASRDFPNLPKNTAQLLEKARLCGTDVIHIRVGFKADRSDWPPLVWDDFGPLAASPEAEPEEWARERAGEKVFTKHSFDAFTTTTLEAHLRERGIEALYVAGMLTSVCVLLSCATAHQLGFRPYLIDECCGDDDLQRHEWTKRTYQRLAFKVKTLEEACGELDSGR